MIYFFIYYQSKEKESQNDVEFLVPEDNNLAPKCIYVEESYENKTYSYKKIFKVNKSTKMINISSLLIAKEKHLYMMLASRKEKKD